MDTVRLIVAVLVLGLSGVAVAETNTALSFSQAPNASFGAAYYSLGYEFTVTEPAIVVTHLGYYDSGNDGLAVSHQVGIFDANPASPGYMSLVLVGTVGPGVTMLEGGYRYLDIPDATLAAGTYRIAGNTSNTNLDAWPYNWSDEAAANLTAGPGITLGLGYNESSALAVDGNVLWPHYLNNNAPSNPPYASPNFLYVVPEPSTLALLGLTGLVVGLRRRGGR